MLSRHFLGFLLAGLGGSLALAGTPPEPWNAPYAEKTAALSLKGDIARGAAAFEICQGCHRAGALGRADGSYPRLAGQHANVLVKQMADVRSGRRSNLKMLPFADHQALSVSSRARKAPPRDRGRASIWHVAVNSTNVIARSATGSRARARRTNSSPGFPASTTPTCCAKAA